MGEELCKATIVIDEKGRPKEVSVVGCPSVFHAEVKRALMAWRFYPYKVGGRAMVARFVMPIRFKPK
jgi:outer membrane biosynthesis protein TonB